LQQRFNGISPVYFDNPGGTQVPDAVLEAMKRCMIESNSNTHGLFRTSRQTDQVIAQARQSMADLLNADPDEIVFGPNMTTLTFAMSRAIGRILAAGDEIIVTRMDHDANISPWLLLARDHGLVVRWADFDPETGRLDLSQMSGLITSRTRLVACVYASNALGTINLISEVVALAKTAGALSYIDAVQYAPHGLIDVKALDCDFLVCSAYKFFGPHVGILYGKHEHLDRFPAYKVRPASDQAPDRWETGTQNHEGLAGVSAAVDYLAWVGEKFGSSPKPAQAGLTPRRGKLVQAMRAIGGYEQTLSRRLLEGLNAIQGVTSWGITDPADVSERVPTIIFTVERKAPAEVAERLGQQDIYVWDGDYYAQAVMERLGVADRGGMVRVGAAHYNTIAEVDRFLNVLESIART
jgi:cysteine desulfurase family protein (TIGR01976 family)